MTKMADPHRSTSTAARRRVVAEKYLKGESQYVIARDLSVSQPMVSKDLKIIRAQWRESTLRDYDSLKSEQLEKLSRVEAAAWRGYAKSQLDGMRTLKECSPMGDKVSITTEQRAGDKGWLSVIITCIERRIALLGLNEPTRYAVDFDALSDAQLVAIANGVPVAQVLAQAAPAPLAEA